MSAELLGARPVGSSSRGRPLALKHLRKSTDYNLLQCDAREVMLLADNSTKLNQMIINSPSSRITLLYLQGLRTLYFDSIAPQPVQIQKPQAHR